MTRLDHAIVGGLVALLAVITVAIGAPALAPGAAGLASPSANPSLLETVAYREGSLGRPISRRKSTASARSLLNSRGNS